MWRDEFEKWCQENWPSLPLEGYFGTGGVWYYRDPWAVLLWDLWKTALNLGRGRAS